MNREDILKTATEIVCRDRNNTYGGPEENFNVIAEYWSIYLNKKYEIGVPISAEDIANMMVLFKMGRITTAKTYKADSYIDVAGYAACAAECAEKQLKELYKLADKLQPVSEDAEEGCTRCSNH